MRWQHGEPIHGLGKKKCAKRSLRLQRSDVPNAPATEMGALSILAYVRLVICDHLLDACFQLELRPPHLGVEVDKRATVQQRCILETPLTRRKHTNKPHAKPLLGASKTNSEFKCASLHTLPPDRHPCALSLTGRADPDLAGRAIKSQSKMCHSVS
jgi:hypothetical protein